MTCRELAARIERLQPNAGPRDVARLCLLLANHVEDLESLADDARLLAAWREVSIRLEAATDQHAAMTEELQSMAETDPRRFTAEEVWTLVRSIRVQGQVLGLYVAEARVAVEA